jgi:hypothetical protein
MYVYYTCWVITINYQRPVLHVSSAIVLPNTCLDSELFTVNCMVISQNYILQLMPENVNSIVLTVS